MRLTLFLTAILCSLFSIAQEIPYVVFNELNVDNPGGPDTQEFVELYGTPDASLDSLVIVLFDGTTDQSYAAFDLDGYVLDAGGYFVLGDLNAVNVDYVVPNASIQNGADGIALYHADAADFPNNTPATTVDLIDAAVYGTADATDAGLIAALGLDVAIVGYTQLDETAQQTGADLSLSRLPNGGIAFDYSLFVLQEITPGVSNVPLCAGGNILLTDQNQTLTFCDNLNSSVVHFAPDGAGYGTAMLFVTVDGSGNIAFISETDSVDFAGYASGTYNIYVLYHNGTLDPATITPGSPFNGITDSDCISVSDNSIVVDITPCGGCIGGDITSTPASVLNFCAGSGSIVDFTSNTTSVDADYIFVIADSSNLIVDTFSVSYNMSLLSAGNYTVFGLSYSGDLDPITIQAGADAFAIAAGTCAAPSNNQIAILVYDCQVYEPCSYVFISEYLEGNNGTKALELFNPTLTTIDLTGYSVLLYSNGSVTSTASLTLSGSLGPLSTYVIANPGTGTGAGAADPAVLAIANITDAVANYSGNDALELRLNDVVIDAIGVVGEDPGNQNGWPVANTSTRNVDMVRMFPIQTPNEIWALSSSQWDIYANTDFSHLGNHIFQTCSSETLAGFVASNLVINENAGTLTISVQGINIQSATTIQVNVTGGSADALDYTASLPTDLIFDGTTNVLTFTIDIINDILAENDETITLSLSTSSPVQWLSQEMTITILQNDPNCNGGFIQNAAGNQPVAQCSDEPNPAVDLTANTNFPTANYAYVITNANDSIIEIVAGPSINLDTQGAGTFHIWGLSYTGLLDDTTTQLNLPVNGIAADSCASISNNFVTVIRSPCIVTGCDGGDVTTNDGASFITICIGGTPTTVIPQNTSQSIDAIYTYYLTDALDQIITEIDGSWNNSSAIPGTYHIWGLSYLGTPDASTTASGMPVAGITSSDCAQLSAGFIEIVVVQCDGPAACTQLFFSEILEDSQSNKALEIYNPAPFAINLADYTINMYSNGSTTPTNVLVCDGFIASHGVYVVVSSGNGQNPTDPELLGVADTLHAVSTFSGNDALELTYLGNTIDMVGIIGDDPGQIGWTFGNTSTANHDLVRRPEVTSPNADWNIVSGQWISYAPTMYTNMGFHDAVSCGNPDQPQVTFTLAAQTVTENTASVTVEIQTNNVTTPFDLTISAAGTATNGSDYSATFPQIINIPIGSSILSFNIDIFGDGLVEGDETIELSMSTDVSVYYVIQNSTITIQDYLSVKENSVAAVRVYPNPANDQVNINSDYKIKSTSIMDSRGSIVSSKSGLNNNTETIDLTALASGNYFITVITEKDVQHIPLMIVH